MGNVIFVVFIVFYLCEFFWESWLVIRNANYANSEGKGIPDELKEYLDQEKYQKTKEYTLSKSKFSIITSIISVILLLLVLYTHAFNYFDQYLRTLISWEIGRGIVYFLTMMIVMSILGIPASIYQTFVLEEKFGFNKTTPKLFVIDFFKGIILSLLMMTPLLYLLLYFVEKVGMFWWIYATIGVFLFQLAVAYIYPVWIAPLFNKFTPLEDGELKIKIEELAKKIGFPLKEIKVMDGSKRSKHSNAYFTGFGKNRRIVLFDTLMDKMENEEILSILAHEMGHWKHKHILKQMVLSLILSFLVFFLLSQVLNYKEFFTAFAIEIPSTYLGFILFGIYFSTITFWTAPFFSWLSRKNEYQADAFAVIEGPDAKYMQSSLIKLNVENLSNLYPHPIFVAFHYSHPPLMARLKHIAQVKSK